MTRFVCWNEPLWTKDGPICSGMTMAPPEDCAGAQRKFHPEFKYKNDEEALNDFMVVRWAWFIELVEPYPWVPKTT